MLCKRVALAALGVLLVMGIVVSPAAALSTNNPQWHRCEPGVPGLKFIDSACNETLEGGEAGEFGVLALESGTRGVMARALGAQELIFGETHITCKKLSLNEGANVTGAPPEGLSGAEATINYEQCEVPGRPACEINKAAAGEAVINTALLKATEAYRTKEAAEHEEAQFATVLEPEEPTEGKEIYASVNFSGSCPSSGNANVEGQLALEDVNGSSHALELQLSAPESAITSVFVNSEGKTTEKVVRKASEGAFVGAFAVLLPSGRTWWQSTL